MRRTVSVLAGLLLSAGAAGQPSPSTTETQFFPEVDAFFKYTETGRIVLETLGTVGPRDSQSAAVGLAWDQSFGDHVSVLGGYYFEYDPTPVVRDQRIRLALSLRFPVAWRFLATDRSLFEARWLDGKPSQRYRNMLTLEKEYIGPFGIPYTLDLDAEVYYDTRTHAWDHQEYTAGVATLLSQKLSVELYYQRLETQGGSQPAHVNAVGVTIQLFLEGRAFPVLPLIIEPSR
jgi:hypothetical protein